MSYKSIHMIQIYKRKNNYIGIEEIVLGRIDKPDLTSSRWVQYRGITSF